MEEEAQQQQQQQQPSPAIKPELSQYFGAGNTSATGPNRAANVSARPAAVTAPAAPLAPVADNSSFFDQINAPQDDAVLHSCRESKVDLAAMEKKATAGSR